MITITLKEIGNGWLMNIDRNPPYKRTPAGTYATFGGNEDKYFKSPGEAMLDATNRIVKFIEETEVV